MAKPFPDAAFNLSARLYYGIPHSSSAFCIGGNFRIPHSSRPSAFPHLTLEHWFVRRALVTGYCVRMSSITTFAGTAPPAAEMTMDPVPPEARLNLPYPTPPPVRLNVALPASDCIASGLTFLLSPFPIT